MNIDKYLTEGKIIRINGIYEDLMRKASIAATNLLKSKIKSHLIKVTRSMEKSPYWKEVTIIVNDVVWDIDDVDGPIITDEKGDKFYIHPDNGIEIIS